MSIVINPIDLEALKSQIGGDKNSWGPKEQVRDKVTQDKINEIIEFVNDSNFSKLDKDGYIGTAQDLKDGIDLKQNITDNTLNTTNKTIVGAINELNTNISIIDTGAIMGVRFIDNSLGFNAERYGLAKGKTFSYSTNGNTTTINSDFDTMPIYKYMRRGIFNNDSVLVFDQDAVGYDDTLSTGGLAPHTHWVGVYIPKFYFRINVTFAPTYVMDIAVSDKAFAGSLVHPVFTQHSNTGDRKSVV